MGSLKFRNIYNSVIYCKAFFGNYITEMSWDLEACCNKNYNVQNCIVMIVAAWILKFILLHVDMNSTSTFYIFKNNLTNNCFASNSFILSFTCREIKENKSDISNLTSPRVDLPVIGNNASVYPIFITNKN